MFTRWKRENNRSWAEIYIAVVTLMGWIALGTVVFHWLEGWSRIQSFYFSVVTITTVGYGDLSPSSDASRLFTSIYILVGVSIGLATLGIIGARILEYRLRKFDIRKTKQEQQ